MKYIIVLILIFSLLFLATSISAKPSDLFINYLSSIIYKDCYGKDIQIKEGYIVREPSKDPVTHIEWNEEAATTIIRRIIEFIGQYEPFNDYSIGCANKEEGMMRGLDGCDILTCEGHKLDIDGYIYSWDDTRIDVPKEEFKTIYGDSIETYGDKSPVTTGDNSPINQEEKNIWIQLFWSKGTIAGAIIGFLLKVLYDFLKKKFYKRKKLSSKKPESPE